MLKVLNRNKDLLFVTLLVVGAICIVANPGFCADISLGESDTIAKGLEKFFFQHRAKAMVYGQMQLLRLKRFLFGYRDRSVHRFPQRAAATT